MTQATDQDIREIKTAIDTLAKATEANTKAIDTLSTRFVATATATEANTKAIADLTLEMRLGFSEIKGDIKQVEAKLTGRIDNVEAKLEGKIDALGEKFEERTKGLGQRLDGKELATRNISTGLTVTIVGGTLLAFAKYLFFGTTP
jgi:uncharacterized protein YpuA (DUF1002 family)